MTETLSQPVSRALVVANVWALALAICIGAAKAQARSGATHPLSNAANPHPASSSSGAPTSSAPPPPKCLARPLAPARTGQHKVFLNWNASPSSSTVGYCLYRRKTPNIPRKISACTDCEQINPAPIHATGCVDDSVQDNATYYYVVTAIDRHSNMSDASNEVTPISTTPPSGSFPSCRPN